jgi:hypothetical protein
MVSEQSAPPNLKSSRWAPSLLCLRPNPFGYSCAWPVHIFLARYWSRRTLADNRSHVCTAASTRHRWEPRSGAPTYSFSVSNHLTWPVCPLAVKQCQATAGYWRLADHHERCQTLVRIPPCRGDPPSHASPVGFGVVAGSLRGVDRFAAAPGNSRPSVSWHHFHCATSDQPILSPLSIVGFLIFFWIWFEFIQMNPKSSKIHRNSDKFRKIWNHSC